MFFQLLGVFTILSGIFRSFSNNVGAEAVGNADDGLVPECKFYLVPSSNPKYGRGIVSGMFIEADQEIYRSIVLAIHTSHLESTQLANYVFGTNEDGIAIAQLGLDMLYNHRDYATVTRVWAPGHQHMFEDQLLPHATHTEVRIITKKKVSGRYQKKSS